MPGEVWLIQDADMEILITGGDGFIGANLALEIEKRFPSCQVAVLDDLSSGHARNIGGFKGATRNVKI